MAKINKDTVFHSLSERLTARFGEKLAGQVMFEVVGELGGLRVRMPTHEELYRQTRDEKIRSLFTGDNHEALSLRFGVTKRHVRRILGEGC